MISEEAVENLLNKITHLEKVMFTVLQNAYTKGALFGVMHTSFNLAKQFNDEGKIDAGFECCRIFEEAYAENERIRNA